jgi:hypothetical protein
MKLHHVVVLMSLCGICVSASAETLVCPELSTLVQVGACPAEEELQHTFDGYCSDNARLYDKGDKICPDFQRYKELKNISLWESRDGRFDGYVSCNPAKSGLIGARANDVTITRQGSVTRVACSYTSGVVLSHRTKANCVADSAACATDAGACKASCE